MSKKYIQFQIVYYSRFLFLDGDIQKSDSPDAVSTLILSHNLMQEWLHLMLTSVIFSDSSLTHEIKIDDSVKINDNNKSLMIH